MVKNVMLVIGFFFVNLYNYIVLRLLFFIYWWYKLCLYFMLIKKKYLVIGNEGFFNNGLLIKKFYDLGNKLWIYLLLVKEC